jgi:Cu(I)/Ag(I) efflux system membrane fusion protein/cobalt-zinc-cadmium efflux system membrane fusion protein
MRIFETLQTIFTEKGMNALSVKRIGILAGGFLLLGFVLGYLIAGPPSDGGHGSTPSTAVEGGSGKKERKIKYWWDPMDPSFISDKPGKSPMGMDMVPVYEDEVEDTGAVTINPSVVQNMGVRIVEVKRGPLHKVIRAVGHVDYDETKLFVVSLKLNGWIEKLHADQTGQVIRKGEKLFDIYSPQLVSAQQDFLLQTGRGKSDKGIGSEARTRLEYYDVDATVIDELIRRGRPEKAVPIFSKYSGVLVEKNVLEGEFVSSGNTVLKIADLSKVWVYVHLYESEIAWVREGQTALMTLPYHPGKSFAGKVTYIYPYVEKATRDIQVRLEFENPELELKPDMFANVEIHSDLKDSVILVPDEAILRSGKRELVFLAAEETGKFVPVDVRSGLESMDGYVEILSGLKPGDRVVSSGQFMLDTESKLKEAIQKMMKADAKTPINLEYEPSMNHAAEGSGKTHDTPTAPTAETEMRHEEGSGTDEPTTQSVPHQDDAVFVEGSGRIEKGGPAPFKEGGGADAHAH